VTHACDVCKRPGFGSAVPRDASTAAKHPLWLALSETHGHMCGEDLILLYSWEVCIDCRPKVEDFLYQAINGVLAGAQHAFNIQSQKSRPKIKRRKR
jgi:hypothetical protein